MMVHTRQQRNTFLPVQASISGEAIVVMIVVTSDMNSTVTSIMMTEAASTIVREVAP